jgi:hypothetical protein
MALGTTGITRTAIRTETGLSSYLGSELMGSNTLSPYSFYGPGRLSVDANKDIITLAPTVSKQGDFRSYNHTAIEPHAQADFVLIP